MKVRSVTWNNRRRSFEVRTHGKSYSMPFARTDPKPTADDPVERAFPDAEIAREAFTYVLRSGREGTVHVDQVMEYNKDPDYLRDLLLYKLTLEARRRIDSSPLSKREITRRLGTSATQLYRLLDPTNYRKSIDQVLSLLQALDCEVDLVIKRKSA